MRCPDCSKFASLETQDPEVNDLEAAALGEGKFQIIGSVRLVRTCADCGTELKEATFDIDQEVEADESPPKGFKLEEVEIEETGVESTESGGGRYAKNMIGYVLHYKLTAGDKTIHEGSLDDSIAAGQMDEMV